VLDIELPGMNGFRIVEELNIRGLTFPTLLMTGRPGKAVNDRATAAGLPPILEKPLAGRTLVDAIRTALQLS
jgi:FixJ family two-component response regulator